MSYGIYKSSLVVPQESFEINKDSWQASALHAWWPTIPNSGLRLWDASPVGRYPMAIRSGPVWSGSPSGDFGLAFNGSGDTYVTDSDGNPSEFSWVIWCMPATVSTNMGLCIGSVNDGPFGAWSHGIQIVATGAVRNYTFPLSGATTGNVISAYNLYCIVSTTNSSECAIYVNGVKIASGGGGTPYSGINGWHLGSGMGGGFNGFQGWIYDARLYYRALKEAEVAQISSPEGRYELYLRPERTYIIPPNNYTVTADNTSFALTGQSSAFVNIHVIKPDVYAASLTGQAAALNKGRLVSVDASSFALSGQTASLGKGFKLQADTYAATMTGQATTFVKGKTMTASVYSASMTGQTTTLRTTRRVNALATTYFKNEQDANFYRGRKMVATVRTFSLSGKIATLKTAVGMIAGTRAFTLTGNDADLRGNAKVVTANVGVFAGTGVSARLIGPARIMAGAATSYTYTGKDADVVYRKGLGATLGSFSLSTPTVGLRSTRLLSTNVYAVTFVGKDAVVGRVISMLANPVSFAVLGQANSLIYTKALAASSRAFITTGIPVTFLVNRNLKYPILIDDQTVNIEGSVDNRVVSVERVTDSKSIFILINDNRNLNGGS